MATLAATPIIRGRLSAIRCAATGAVALGGVFLLCWLGAAAGWTGASHMFVALFTIASTGSVVALAVGLCWSIAFGALVGALIALAYNGLGFLER
jgi:hypothetical protein